MLATASFRVTEGGKALREAAVDNATAGVSTMREIDSGQGKLNADIEPSHFSQQMAKPPSKAAAALSPCPSSSVAVVKSCSKLCLPKSSSYRRKPATVAAALLPSPEPIGISLSTARCSDGK